MHGVSVQRDGGFGGIPCRVMNSLDEFFEFVALVFAEGPWLFVTARHVYIHGWVGCVVEVVVVVVDSGEKE